MLAAGCLNSALQGVRDSGLSPERSGGLGSFPRKEWGTRVFPQKAPKVGVFQCVSSCPVSLLPLTAVEPGGSGPVRGAVGPGDAVLLVHWTCCVYMAGVAGNIIGLICSP